MNDETLVNGQALDVRRKRLKFRAWHRGIKEMDLIMGTFADTHVATLTETEINQFEELLEEADATVFSWITHGQTPPEPFNTALFERIRKLDFMDGLPEKG
ncbi:MAG: succinate dehydrogenase assembly factor 2 [Parvibaculum sp.]